MKPLVVRLFRLYIFWMVLFAAGRVFFLLYYSHTLSLSGISLFEIPLLFLHALRLDTATFCYWGTGMALLISLEALTRFRLLTGLIRWLNWVLMFLFLLVVAGETGLYAEWQTKLSIKALLYLANPSEVVNSAQTHTLVILTSFVVAGCVAGGMFYQWLFRRMRPTFSRWWQAPVFFFLAVPVLVTGARGGLQEIPINQSQSYFSRHEMLNQTAVNPVFNLYISWFENRQFRDSNPFRYMDDESAAHIVDSLFARPARPAEPILTTSRPNVVMLILESWSADLIESLGGEAGITPEFRKLEEEGILFREAYAGGKRSEQGLAALLSAFPPHPYTSITVQPDKYRHLPSVVHIMNAAGYHSSFYFGGQLIYGNIKSYIHYNDFHRIKEIYDFKLPNRQGKLGIHDEYTLAEQLLDLSSEPVPFFSALFTLSSHSPYDQPMEEKLPWGGNERKYINSAYYTDACLGRYFQEARKQPWYDNTLFILVADHSHNSYRNWHPNSFAYNRIPVLFYGKVIREEYRGMKIDRLVSQTDVGTTLLQMLQLPDDDFRWGRDMLNPASPAFSYITFDYGSGIKGPEGEYVWDHSRNKAWPHQLPDSLHARYDRNAKAFLQVLFGEYIAY